MIRPRPIVPPGPVVGGAARRSRGARAVTVAMILSGCSTLSESRSPTASLTVLVPPPAVAAHSPDVAPSPPLVWIPEWGIHLRGGQDVVLHHGVYYRYDGGRWYASRSARGPWTQLGSPRVGPEQDEAQTPTHRRRGTAPALAIDKALTYVGVPYRWGGSTPAGFDCSGFVRYVYARSGIALPRTVAEQYRVGTPVHRGSLRPGDLVFFDRLRHNGIYIGHGEFVHASSGAGRVSVSRLDEDWFRHRWSGGRRMQSGTAAADVTRAVTGDAFRDAAEPGD